MAAQRRREAGPSGYHDEHGRRGDPLQHQLDQLERGRVDPVRVLDQQQHRAVPSQAEKLVDQSLQRPGSPLLRCQVERAVARGPVDLQQRREHRRHRANLVDRLA
jgi:hypothetical protein